MKTKQCCHCKKTLSIDSFNTRKPRRKKGGEREAVSRCKPCVKLYKNPLYHTWQAMVYRCHNPKSKDYKRYGGRGISVCDRWRSSPEAFYMDIGQKPSSNHTVDRVDNSKGYSKENCRWATQLEQQNNRSDTIKITYQGETMSISQTARKYGIRVTTFHYRINSGMSVSEAVETPIGVTSKYHKKENANV